MPSFMLNLSHQHDQKTKIIERLKRDWDGTDHPLWRHEAAEKLNFAIETLLCIIAMSKKPTNEASAAATALIYITGWDEDEFNENVSDVLNRIMLLNEQEGGMQ